MGQPLIVRDFCIWDKARAVDTGERFGKVPAWWPIEQDFGDRNYCTDCWIWLLETDKFCPACGLADSLQMRPRQLSGWLGIQRFFDMDDYGVDLIRNGRVIEERSKHFFSWESEDGERLLEYPIDQTYWGGRIVGELQCDFVPLASHQKDSFDRGSYEWRMVVEHIRGRGPILQQKRRALGYQEDNLSPLARLHAGYRRGQPAGLRWLVPGDAEGKGFNTESQNWATLYWQALPEYRSDGKWYAAAVMAQEALDRKRGKSLDTGATGGDLFPPQADDGRPGEEMPDVNGDQPVPVEPGPTQDYEKDEELSLDVSLPNLPGSPTLHVTTQRILRGSLRGGLHLEVAVLGNNLEIAYDPSHAYFTESVASPVDCLLEELAYQLMVRSSSSQREWPISQIIYELRKRYYASSLVSLEDIRKEAGALLDELLEHYSEALSAMSPLPGDELTPKETQELAVVVARKERAGMDRVREIIEEGSYPTYMGHRWLLQLFTRKPELAMDGRFFSLSYSDVDPALRVEVIDQLISSLKDLLWVVDPNLSNNSGAEWRNLLVRAASSIRLLSIWRS